MCVFLLIKPFKLDKLKKNEAIGKTFHQENHKSESISFFSAGRTEPENFSN